jgi:DNA invertase Pin-like site-specific DNA recombinase
MASQDLQRVVRAAARVDRLTGDLDAAREELRQAVRQAHQRGESVSALARALGVTRTRIYQMLN